jgi:hypothetical protein
MQEMVPIPRLSMVPSQVPPSRAQPHQGLMQLEVEVKQRVEQEMEWKAELEVELEAELKPVLGLPAILVLNYPMAVYWWCPV